MQPAADAMARGAGERHDQAAGGAAGRQCAGVGRSPIRTRSRSAWSSRSPARCAGANAWPSWPAHGVTHFLRDRRRQGADRPGQAHRRRRDRHRGRHARRHRGVQGRDRGGASSVSQRRESHVRSDRQDRARHRRDRRHRRRDRARAARAGRDGGAVRHAARGAGSARRRSSASARMCCRAICPTRPRSRRWCPTAEKAMGQLDILVSNAGITRDNLFVQLQGRGLGRGASTSI